MSRRRPKPAPWPRPPRRDWATPLLEHLATIPTNTTDAEVAAALGIPTQEKGRP